MDFFAVSQSDISIAFWPSFADSTKMFLNCWLSSSTMNLLWYYFHLWGNEANPWRIEGYLRTWSKMARALPHSIYGRDACLDMESSKFKSNTSSNHHPTTRTDKIYKSCWAYFLSKYLVRIWMFISNNRHDMRMPYAIRHITYSMCGAVVGDDDNDVCLIWRHMWYIWKLKCIYNKYYIIIRYANETNTVFDRGYKALSQWILARLCGACIVRATQITTH